MLIKCVSSQLFTSLIVYDIASYKRVMFVFYVDTFNRIQKKLRLNTQIPDTIQHIVQNRDRKREKRKKI